MEEVALRQPRGRDALASVARRARGSRNAMLANAVHDVARISFIRAVFMFRAVLALGKLVDTDFEVHA